MSHFSLQISTGCATAARQICRLALVCSVLLFNPLLAGQVVAEDGAKDYAALYQRSCFACHSTGAAGAPLTGNAAAWQERIDAKGMDGLVDAVVNGSGGMPPGGLCGDCSTDDILALIKFMMQ